MEYIYPLFKSYDIIEHCKNCKREKYIETVESEHRIKPVYKMIERCVYCENPTKPIH